MEGLRVVLFGELNDFVLRDEIRASRTLFANFSFFKYKRVIDQPFKRIKLADCDVAIAFVLLSVSRSASDAVDGSSTGTRVPWMWALLRLPRFRGAKLSLSFHASKRYRPRSAYRTHLTRKTEDHPRQNISVCEHFRDSSLRRKWTR